MTFSIPPEGNKKTFPEITEEEIKKIKNFKDNRSSYMGQGFDPNAPKEENIPEEIKSAMIQAGIPVGAGLSKFKYATNKSNVDVKERAENLSGKDLSLNDIKGFASGSNVVQGPQQEFQQKPTEPTESVESVESVEEQDVSATESPLKDIIVEEMQREVAALNELYKSIELTDEDIDNYFLTCMAQQIYTHKVISKNELFTVVFKEKTPEELDRIDTYLEAQQFRSDIQFQRTSAMLSFIFGTKNISMRLPSGDIKVTDIQGTVENLGVDEALKLVRSWPDMCFKMLSGLMVNFDMRVQKLAREAHNKNF